MLRALQISRNRLTSRLNWQDYFADKSRGNQVKNTAYLGKRFVKDPAMVFRKIGDECLLVPVRQNVADLESFYFLNEVGGRIWELIDGQRVVEEIKEIILSEFDASPIQAEEDLIAFLQQLQERGGIKAL
jgi:hypothetical protein